jgi:hypothetical protein
MDGLEWKWMYKNEKECISMKMDVLEWKRVD